MEEIREKVTSQVTAMGLNLERLYSDLQYLNDVDQQKKVGSNRKELPTLDKLMSDMTEFKDDFKTLMCLLHVRQRCITVQQKCGQLRRKRLKEEDECSSDGSVCGIPCSRGFPCQKNEMHQDVLIDAHTELMKDLHLDGDLLDSLIEKDVISASDRDDITTQETAKKRNRKLLLTLRRYGESNFHKFMDSLKGGHPHLHKVLHEGVCKNKTETERRKSLTDECIVCKIAKNVDVEDVVDQLYNKRVLCTNTMETVLREQNTKKAWCLIFTNLRKTNNGNILFGEILNKKYSELANILTEMPETLNCRCESVEQQQEGAEAMTKNTCTRLNSYSRDETEVKQCLDSRLSTDEPDYVNVPCYPNLSVCDSITHEDHEDLETIYSYAHTPDDQYSDVDDEQVSYPSAWDNPTYFCQKRTPLRSVSSDEGIVADIGRHRFNRTAFRRK